MAYRSRTVGLLAVFIAALIDASQDLLAHGEFTWLGGLATVGVAIAAIVPLCAIRLSWHAARSNRVLASFLGALFFAFMAVLLIVWGHQVYLGAARPEGAAQMHLLFFPAAGILVTPVALLLCYLAARLASALLRVTPNPSVKGTSCGKPQAAPYLER
jgi:hypothetical protein